MPSLGKNNIAPAIDNITIIFAIELLTIKGLKIMMPSKVKQEARRESTEKNCSSNPKLSISNQVRPGPGPGIALKAEAIGLAVMTELPIVVINVQRGGP